MQKRILSTLIIFIGVVLLAYPWISNWLFEHRANSIVNSYRDAVEDTEGRKQERMFLQAEQYNDYLAASKVVLTDPFLETEEQRKAGLEYETLLNYDESGLMGYIEIPCISINLPIWHGTDAHTLEKGIGHLEGSSLPVGGADTHVILTGHTGLNVAKLFTDLTEMNTGDLFFLHIGIRDLAYEVTEINIIKPEDFSGLMIKKGEDLVTLITCTPYGVNTHRLCVTGARIDYTETVYAGTLDDHKIYDSYWMHTYMKAVMIGVALSFLCLIIVYLIRRKGILFEKQRC